MISPRPYQREALDAIHAAYDQSVTHPLVVLPTGTGKTIVFGWVQPGNAWVLAIPQGRITLIPNGGTYDVVEMGPAGRRVLASGLPLGYAQGMAEALIRQAGAVVLNSPTARWRFQPATEKQLALLRRKRVSLPPGLTKGEASKLITATLAGGAR